MVARFGAHCALGKWYASFRSRLALPGVSRLRTVARRLPAHIKGALGGKARNPSGAGGAEGSRISTVCAQLRNQRRVVLDTVTMMEFLIPILIAEARR